MYMYDSILRYYDKSSCDVGANLHQLLQDPQEPTPAALSSQVPGRHAPPGQRGAPAVWRSAETASVRSLGPHQTTCAGPLPGWPARSRVLSESTGRSLLGHMQRQELADLTKAEALGQEVKDVVAVSVGVGVGPNLWPCDRSSCQYF